MYKSVKFTTLIFLLILTSATVTFGDEKLGKLFIKAASTEIDGQQLPDMELEMSVKDMKKRVGKFILVDKEIEADFLIIILERIDVPSSDGISAKSIRATLYVRDNAKWKPATKLQSGVNNAIWGAAARNIIKNAEKWVKANVNQ